MICKKVIIAAGQNTNISFKKQHKAGFTAFSQNIHNIPVGVYGTLSTKIYGRLSVVQTRDGEAFWGRSTDVLFRLDLVLRDSALVLKYLLNSQ